jgi:hypothetical protein
MVRAQFVNKANVAEFNLFYQQKKCVKRPFFVGYAEEPARQWDRGD